MVVRLRRVNQFRSHAFTGTPTVSCLQRSSIYLGTGGSGSQPDKLQPLFGFRGIEVVTCSVSALTVAIRQIAAVYFGSGGQGCCLPSFDLFEIRRIEGATWQVVTLISALYLGLGTD
ncbi:hypothetical protein B0H13DRAFT_1853312 [Mycena leptocephala]|nr:hypothetical protein B0H13DRAFT_1853312 [Mycena leptocephala]